LFTYLCYKSGEIVPELKNETNIAKDTLLVA
jgi:hypothetical protein